MYDLITADPLTSRASLPPMHLDPARARAPGVSEFVWARLVDEALFVSETVAQAVTELEVRVWEEERRTGRALGRVNCDELGANYLQFYIEAVGADAETLGLELLRRAARSDARVESVRCVASSPGSARLRVCYRTARVDDA